MLWFDIEIKGYEIHIGSDPDVTRACTSCSTVGTITLKDNMDMLESHEKAGKNVGLEVISILVGKVSEIYTTLINVEPAVLGKHAGFFIFGSTAKKSFYEVNGSECWRMCSWKESQWSIKPKENVSSDFDAEVMRKGHYSSGSCGIQSHNLYPSRTQSIENLKDADSMVIIEDCLNDYW